MTHTTLALPPLTPISWGELIDKITILEIKKSRISAPWALKNVSNELDMLNQIAKPGLLYVQAVYNFKNQLSTINRILWDIEDAIRGKEAAKDFGAEFIELARAVYKTNDERASIKRKINELMKSPLREEKSYQPY